MEELNLHPVFVHFPIALFVSAFVFEIVSLATKKEVFHKTALNIYVLGAFLSTLAVYTGHDQMEHHGLHHPVMEDHEHFGFAVMWTSLLSLPLMVFIYQKYPQHSRKVFLVFAFVMAVLVMTTGYYGGRLVYEYAIGVAK